MDTNELAEQLSDFFRSKNSGRHWGQGSEKEPIRKQFGGSYTLGVQDADTQLRILEETQLSHSRDLYNQPRLGVGHHFAVTFALVKECRFHLQTIIAIDNPKWLIGKTAVLDWGTLIGRPVTIAQNEIIQNRYVTQNCPHGYFNPVRKTEENRIITRNGFFWFETNRPYDKRRVHDLIAIF